jgi:hypothetical protein
MEKYPSQHIFIWFAFLSLTFLQIKERKKNENKGKERKKNENKEK